MQSKLLTSVIERLIQNVYWDRQHSKSTENTKFTMLMLKAKHILECNTFTQTDANVKLLNKNTLYAYREASKVYEHNKRYIRAHRYRSPHLLTGSSESCLPWQNNSEGIIREFPVCHWFHNVIACNKADRGTIPIHVSTNMLTLDALHREAAIELIEALSSSNGATNNIYEIATCKLATFQNDARRTIHRGEVEVQTRRAY